ncbi:MAG TPA: ABC transporter permease [Bryobacteraceae bacterium]|jgi:putative ABC transport system permease protein|nr:ABC transporter permease [Bryobacteraceae bacterium]
MPFSQRLKSLWRNLARKQRVEADLDAEIRSYREMLEDEKIRAGASPAVARREALLELGGAEQLKEGVRDIRMGAGLEAFGTELRQSLRGLRRNPGLSLVVVGILALAMGASTAVFSIFQSALLKPLPFRDSDRVVELAETRLARGMDQVAFSQANFWDVRAQNRSFEEVAAFHYDEANLTGDGPAERVTAAGVTAGFFRTLGVSPVLGRDFSYDEEHGPPNLPGWNGASVVILGNKFWKTRYAADPNILGKTLRLSDRNYTVVGVLPPGEPWIDRQVYLPFGYRPNPDRSSWEYFVIGRLKRGTTLEAARADLQQIARVLARDYPKDDTGIGFRVDPSSAWIAGNTTRRALCVLLGAVVFFLLIACLNIANLLLSRGMARQREIAVRTALGAGRAQLVRLVMMESFLLSGCGAVLGILLAYAVVHTVRTLEVLHIPRLADASLNPWVLSFAALVAVLTGLLSGLAPALQTPSTSLATALREGDRQTGTRRHGRLRAVLVTLEVALSFLLLVGAGLLMRSFSQLMTVNHGFQTENRLLFSLSMPGPYWQKGVGKRFLDRFFERLKAEPDVIAAGAVSTRPVEGDADTGMGIDSVAQRADQRPPWAGWRIVTPGYFRAVGLPLVRGRLFDEADQAVWQVKGQPVPQRHVILSDRLAKRIFPNADPIGQHVLLWKGPQGGMEAEVVGVVGDCRERGLASGPSATAYIPYGPVALTGEFVIHTRDHPLAFAPVLRSIIAGLDSNLPISDVRSFEEVMERSVAPQRFNATLLAVFSGLALLLATVGIYGVLSYAMTRRTPEIGLRMALGASRGNILRMTLGQGLRPALVGIVLGAFGAGWLSRYMTALLFGVKPFDLQTYAAVAALLIITAAVACYLPGRRAMGTDPALALRAE